MPARFLVCDVFDGLAELEAASVDMVMTSPPFLALRSYLSGDHEHKAREIGSEATPADFIDTMLDVVSACGRVLAPHGSIVFELGDTYAGSGGGGGDYRPEGMRSGQTAFDGSAARGHHPGYTRGDGDAPVKRLSDAWPMPKSKCLIPELFAAALAYGINPLTGDTSPAGRWRVRNVVAWCRTNPPVGELGDKWRPAHSTLVVATRAQNRYWDDLATRTAYADGPPDRGGALIQAGQPRAGRTTSGNTSGAPMRDWFILSNSGYTGSHYATYPEGLCAPFIHAMCPERVCTTCGEPARRVVEKTPEYAAFRTRKLAQIADGQVSTRDAVIRPTGFANAGGDMNSEYVTAGWTDCGHDTWRRGVVLDPFAGTGSTLAAAVGHGRDAIGIDLDARNLDHARARLGLFLMED